MNQLGAVEKEVGVTSGSVVGEVGDTHGALVQIEGAPDDSELKVPGKISGGTLDWVFRDGQWNRTVQPLNFEARLAEDAGRLRFCLEQDRERNARVIVDGYGHLWLLDRGNFGPNR